LNQLIQLRLIIWPIDVSVADSYMWSRHCTLNIQRKSPHSRKWTLHLSCAVFFTIASIGWRHLLCNVWVVGTMATDTVVGNSWKSSTIYVSDVAVIKGLAMKRGFQPRGWHTLVNISVWALHEIFEHRTKSELKLKAWENMRREMIQDIYVRC
jgi:hypothetical protein